MRLGALMMALLPGLCLGEMYDSEYQICSENSTQGIVECVSRLTQQWDKRLNVSYRELMNGSEAPEQAALKSAQRLWIQYRDANCGYYAAAPGTISRVMAAECLRFMTKERTCELEAANRMEGRPKPGCG